MNLETFVLIINDREEVLTVDEGLKREWSGFLRKKILFRDIPWQRFFTNQPSLNEGRYFLKSRTGQAYEQLTFLEGRSHRKVIVFSRVVENQEASVSKREARGEKMKSLLRIIENVASVDSTVLFLGETGVGKSWFAQYLYEQSNRKDGPFISVNCSTLPPSLIEAELFGYEQGAFTGGDAQGKIGLFEAADGGVIFLDEIAELPYSMQSKLLEVLQNQKIRRIGGTESIQVDVRIIAATNESLIDLVREKKFREDLYYRLNVVPLTIPPLRERREEIIPLATSFFERYNAKYGTSVPFTNDLKKQFMSHHWGGNIRELENTIERIVVTQQTTFMPVESVTDVDIYPSLREAKYEFEKRLILDAYERLGTTYKVAEALKVDQSTISKKMTTYREEGI